MISLQPNADSILIGDMNDGLASKETQAAASANCRLSLAFQSLTEVPLKVLKTYSSSLQELDLSHNSIQYPWPCSAFRSTLSGIVAWHNGKHQGQVMCRLTSARHNNEHALRWRCSRAAVALQSRDWFPHSSAARADHFVPRCDLSFKGVCSLRDFSHD